MSAVNTEENQKNIFFADMLRETEKPLNDILEYAQMLKNDISDEERKKLADNILLSGNMIKSLSKEINSMYMNPEFSVFIDDEAYKIRHLISNVYNTVNLQLGDKKLNLILSINPTLPVNLKGDIMKIKNILLNIIGMAINSISEGSVTLSVDWNGDVDDAIFVFNVEYAGKTLDSDSSLVSFLFSNFTAARYRTEMIGGSLFMNETENGKRFTFTISQTVDKYIPIGENTAEIIMENKYNLPESRLVSDEISESIINIEKCLIYFSGNMEEYLDVLSAVYQDYLKNKDLTDDITKIKNFEKYKGILLSFKSISKLIGADKLTRVIRANEYAYNHNDYEFMKNNMAVTASIYNEAMQRVRSILIENGRSVEPNNLEIPENKYTKVGESLLKIAYYIDNFEVKAAEKEMKALMESDETDWIKKQVISRGMNMLSTCCYQDVKNLAIALAEGEKV